MASSSSPAPDFAPAAAVAAAFAHFSSLAAAEAPELRIRPPHHIFREDIVKCLERASRRLLKPTELAFVARCFALDASALISWEEFTAALEQMQQDAAMGAAATPRAATTNSRARLLAARKKGGAAPLAGPAPLTSSQAIGWYAAASHTAAFKSPRERVAPLKGSDVTRGNEGTTLASYYGAALGQAF